ncbi:SixA phosphatase family protein [Crenothrix polyspora]|uniref:Phosphohistidine phosphatase SixA n=1 Tax=Crenothrix polyspora TaxID=360316 RepID=A0A1R4HI35_9GAMM|nr:histidine phosphatase family protein [Crenothrix polyspora]SJM95883.1 Phosphohistidine phosphatase SixA [Crenothrix polyspora]
MSRELWLLRHAKAEQLNGAEDFDRNLKKRGKRDATLIGQWLNENDLRPDVVISSPALRAIATAKIVCDVIGINHKDIRQENRLYDEGLYRVKTVLADCPKQFSRVLLVGHNPELEKLVTCLVYDSELFEVKKLLPTGTLARLSLPDDWSLLNQGCATLLSMTQPKTLVEDED